MTITSPGPEAQRTLSREQVEAFHHDLFVEDQVRDFEQMVPPPRPDGWVVDLGGGCGFFARRLQQGSGRRVRVVDLDEASVRTCREAGIEAVLGDALTPTLSGREEAATFNLILHHLVANSEAKTRALQVRALRNLHSRVPYVFINEYIYESFVGHLSGWLIFQITKSRLLSAVGRAVAHVVPSFRANTFGVGVRFRSHAEWRSLFEEAGFEVRATRLGRPETVAPPLRLLVIRTIRRDSFLLQARPAA
jgi:hypothetical protein